MTDDLYLIHSLIIPDEEKGVHYAFIYSMLILNDILFSGFCTLALEERLFKDSREVACSEKAMQWCGKSHIFTFLLTLSDLTRH